MGYTRLTQAERFQISTNCHAGKYCREISKTLGGSAATISCEVRRTRGEYDCRPVQAPARQFHDVVAGADCRPDISLPLELALNGLKAMLMIAACGDR